MTKIIIQTHFNITILSSSNDKKEEMKFENWQEKLLNYPSNTGFNWLLL